MAKVAVIGAGHAGVEAAFTLAKGGASVTLLSDEAVLPYFRPRLIAVAFGQAAPEAIAIKPASAYEQAGICRVQEAVTQLDLATKTVNGVAYDGVIVAQGSQPFVPPFAGASAGRVQTLWSMADALALRETAQAGTSLAIIGGGVLGLEAALRAAMAGMQVSVIEVAPCLLGGVLGAGAEAVLRQTFAEKGITLYSGVSIAEVQAESILLSDGTQVPAAVVLCSAGARPNVALAAGAGAPIGAGVHTSAELSIAPGVYVAGDLANPTARRPVCAVMRAMKMGALAANNLMAASAQLPQTAWQELDLPLFMKVEDVEFHVQGDCRATDVTEERLDDGQHPLRWKSVLWREGKVVGVRWVGTREGFGDWVKRLQA
jgi:NAD(P)H-nitrite reductase large subunit